MSRDRLPPLLALRVFESAARHQSFKNAAEELFVTPGAVSQQIRLLEEHVGVELFVRDGRRVLLSDAGRLAAPILGEAFARMHDAVRQMKLAQRKGRVAVSAAPSFVAKWLMPRLAHFNGLHPDIDVWVSADMALTDFSTSDVDIAIRYGAGGYYGVSFEQLLPETLLPVCSPALFEAAPIRQPSDLLNHILLHDLSAEADASCPDWGMWLKAQGVDGIDAGRGPRFNQHQLVLEAAVAGRGVALARRQLAQSDLSAGRLVPLFESEGAPIEFGYHLVWPQGRDLTKAQETFMDWLRSEADLARQVDLVPVPKKPVFKDLDLKDAPVFAGGMI